MSDNEKPSDCEEINESEEEALLKSDEDQNMKSNVSDSDDSEDQDMEAQLITKYVDVLSRIKDNKYHYDSYVALVDIAHELSDLEKIRQSCELFASVYPLAPEIWLRWLRVEMSIATSPEEVKFVEGLFRRALADYFSAEVALEFGKLTFKASESLAKVIWDELTRVYALHCMKGRQFFVLWRKYYYSRDGELDKNAIVKTYLRELRLPLYNMEESYIEFKVFCEKNTFDIKVDWESVDRKYEVAKDILKEMLVFETKLSETDSKDYKKIAAIYRDYVDLEFDFDATILLTEILYERMVAECCLDASCWMEYARFLDTMGLDAETAYLREYFVYNQTAMDIYNRGLRNCPWSEKMHVMKMHHAERQIELSGSVYDIKEIFETALAAGYQSPEPMVYLWLEYLSYLRRKTNFSSEKEKEILRANFDLAWTSLGKQWGVLADCDCQILQFWGRVEYELLNNPEKGRNLWSTVMESSSNASSSALWLEFAHLELRKGISSARKVFQKALKQSDLDNPIAIVNNWMRLERCYGSVHDHINCQSKCDRFLSDYKKKLQKKNLKRKIESSSQAKNTSPHKRPRQESEQEENKAGQITKPTKGSTRTSGKDNAMNPIKKHEDEEIDFNKDPLRLFLSNLDYNITEEELRAELPELDMVSVDIKVSANGRGRGFGYIELKSVDEVKTALALDRKLVKGRPIYISSVLRDKEHRQKFKYSADVEPRKLFVKGLSYDATKDELEALFKPFGTLSDVRIVYHKSGKPKGIAYIEYEKESSASLAVLKLDQTDFKGSKINVAISAPPPRSNKHEAINTNQLLGMGKQRAAIPKGEQKPRMNLIPMVVRKAIASTSQAAVNGNSAPKPKTNEDFRKFLG